MAKKANIATLKPAAVPPKVWSEDIYIDKQTAMEWRDKKLFERQRPLSPENVIRLSSLMRKGKFTQGTQIYLCVYPNGAETIVNGNHTLEAIYSCGIPQLLTVTRQLVDNINEAGAIYATFDQQRRRNLGDSFRAYGVSPGIKATTKFGSAVSSIARGFVEPEGRWRNRVDHSDIVALSANYMHEVSVFAEFTDRAPSDCKRLLYRAPIMGIILETLHHQPSLAEEFWGAIARDSGLEQDTPEHTFLRYFRNNPSVTSRELWANAASLAWNAKFRGDKACVIQPKGLKHFVLLGTPHDKGVVRSVGLNKDKEATEQEGIS